MSAQLKYDAYGHYCLYDDKEFTCDFFGITEEQHNNFINEVEKEMETELNEEI
jgi:hypothetical protein